MKKLTLSAEPETIRRAREMARESGTSVSSMFERFVRSLVAQQQTNRPLGPLARKASGLIALPTNQSDREVLEDGLLEKHGLDG